MIEPTRIQVKLIGFLFAVAFLIGYAWIFFSAELIDRATLDGDAIHFSRGSFLIETILLPDQTWQIWRADGAMAFGILDRVPYFACAILWLSIAWAIGSFVLKACQVDSVFQSAENAGLATLFGLNALSILILVIGLCGGSGARWPILCGVIGLVGLAFYVYLRIGAPTSHAILKSESIGFWDRRRIILAAFACCILSTFYLLGAVIPPFEFDVREYHLQGPKEFFQTGSIHFLPHNIYANMPMGTEMHALAWMALWGGDDGWFHGALIGKLIIASYSIITAMILGGHVARHVNSLAGWLVACLWLGLPGIAEVSKLGLIDQAVASYLAACIVVLIAMQHRKQSTVAQLTGLLVLLGWFLGSAAACKYTSVPFVVLPGFLIALGLLMSARPPAKAILGSLAVLCVVAMLAGGLWYGKNWVLAGNPVYPLAYNVFGGKTMTSEKALQWKKAHRVPVIAGDSATNLPSDYQLSTLRQELRRIAFESPYLGLLTIPFATIGLLVHRTRTTFVLAIWFFAYLIVWYCFTHRLERFWLPALVMPTILAGWGVAWLLKFEKGIIGTTYLAVGIMTSVCFVALWPFADNRFLVSLTSLRYDQTNADGGTIADTEESLGSAATRVPSHQRWINNQLTNKDRVLIVGDVQVFDIQIPILYSTCFDTSVLESIAVDKPPLEVWNALRDRGITHILVHWGEIARYQSPGNYGFSSVITRKLFQDLESSHVISRTPWPIPSEYAELYQVTTIWE